MSLPQPSLPDSNGTPYNPNPHGVGAAGAIVPNEWSVFYKDPGTLTASLVTYGVEGGIPYADIRIHGTSGTTEAFPEVQIRHHALFAQAVQGNVFMGLVYLRIAGGSADNVAYISDSFFVFDAGFGFLSADSIGGDLDSDPLFPLATAELDDGRIEHPCTIDDAGAAYVQRSLVVGCDPGEAVDITLRIGWFTTFIGAAPFAALAFKGRHGVNIMWPFLGPEVEDPDDPETTYLAEPFTNPAPWAEHAPPAKLAMVKAAGYDHVRLCIVPGPWLEAIDAGPDEPRIAYLFGLIDEAIADLILAGLGVVIDLHASWYVLYTPEDVLTDAPTFALYKEAARRFAERYASTSPALVALELFNEPLPDDWPGLSAGYWPPLLMELYTAARGEMPNHTIVLSAQSWSEIDALAAFDPSPYDANTLWTIHPYLPAIFCHQGVVDNNYSKWVYGLTWPPNAAVKDAAIAAMVALVNADPDLDSGEKAAHIAELTSDLGFFFDVPLNRHWMQAWELGKVAKWCARYGLALGRIYAGEYGVTRTNDGTPGADPPDGHQATAHVWRAAYLHDIRGALDAYGFRKALFALDAIDYGITTDPSWHIGQIQMDLVNWRPSWPAQLPLPSIADYGIEAQDGVLRTEMEVGPARQRRRWRVTPTEIAVQLQLTLDELAIFEAWYRFYGQQGAAWFDITLLGGLGLVMHEARFRGQYKAVPHSGRWWRVASKLEVIDRPILDAGATAIVVTEDVPLLLTWISHLHELVHEEMPAEP